MNKNSDKKIEFPTPILNQFRIDIEKSFTNALIDYDKYVGKTFDSRNNHRAYLLDYAFIELIHSYKYISTDKNDFLAYISHLYEVQEASINQLMENSLNTAPICDKYIEPQNLNTILNDAKKTIGEI